MFTNLERVFTFAANDFLRNFGRSISAIFVLVVTIFLITGLFYLHGISDFIIGQVQNKIDITAYFNSGTADADILNAKAEILKDFPDIKSIQYVSEDDALNAFTAKYQNNQVFSQALNQVGGNPFLPSLNITTNGNPVEYQKIATAMQASDFSSLINSVDFSQKQDTINKVFSITTDINYGGLGLAVILMLIAVLVVFNTIKLAIDNSKEEITTMTIVGASSWFVRAPFIIQGAIFGCISFVICFFVTAALSYFLPSGLQIILSGFSVWDFFLANFWFIILIQLGLGVALGVISSFIVVQKYLKV